MEESDGVGNKREKKRKRNEILMKKKSIDEIIEAAVSDKDPLIHFPSLHYYINHGLSVSLKSGHGGVLSCQLKQYIKVLLKANMEVPFGREWPAEEKVKHREMVAPEARYIFVYETSDCDSNRISNTSEGMVVGFVHYRFVIEEEVPVLYVYELQLEPHVQGKGLGKFLMQLLELIAQKNKMGAVVLTVQKANRSAMNFYTGKLRYTVSAISPSRVDQLLGLQSSYEILCKAFDPEAKTILEENK
ncbi:hypothetical protein Leryth_015257 [Lithospermum erythrorhizon]|nr:hypothetical protein Leryth_015257 [Lithospermum erythrorhizon]